MKKFLLLILFVGVSKLFAQDWPVKKMVTDKKARNTRFIEIPAFGFSASKQLAGRGTYQELKLSSTFLLQVLEQRPEALKISIPLSSRETLNCELVKFELGNIKFTENNDQVVEDLKIPLTYRGIVTGEADKNTVMLTVNENYLSFIATLSDKAVQITKDEKADKSVYRLYNSDNVQFPTEPVTCGTRPTSTSKLVNDLQSSNYQSRSTSSSDKCVNVFIDCFDSLYIWKGSSTQQTVDYVYELFNAVATGYLNEQVNVQITSINVWTSADPYRGDSRENALADLSKNYKDSFWGNICVGLDYSVNSRNGRSGLAGDIGRVKGVSPNTAPAYTVNDHPFCYNDMNYGVSVQNFPTGPNTTGPQIYLVMHEIGHLLGAHHTKWCGWKLTSNPDTYGTLDSCDAIEPRTDTSKVCAQGPAPPATGATIMSYCVTGNKASDFVNFNNGFGPLPGEAVRNFVSKTASIPNCVTCIADLNYRINNDVAVYYKPNHQLRTGILSEQNSLMSGFKNAPGRAVIKPPPLVK